MGKTDAPVVVDAGPLIHLDELECSDLLADFHPLLIPRAVWAEVIKHRAHLTVDILPQAELVDVTDSPSPRIAALCDSLSLHAGETAALILAESQAARLFLCDDAAARLAAESLGLRAHGTIGMLVRSIRRGLRSRLDALGTLRAIPRRSTLHVSPALLASVIAEVEQAGNLP